MKLRTVTIQNFRSFRDETIHFDNYTCLVGPNGGGKSNILTALNILFRNTRTTSASVTNLSEEDFHHRNTSEPIKITVIFEELSETAAEDFKAYYRQGKLIITAVAHWNADSRAAEVKQFGERSVMNAFALFFEQSDAGASAADLKGIYAGFQKDFLDLPNWSSKPNAMAALRAYEEAHPELCSQEASEDQFYGWSKGANRLARHLQWIYVPAVKDASTEQDEAKTTALGQLLERTIRARIDFSEPLESLREQTEEKYQSILSDNRAALTDLSRSLEARLRSWSHPGSRLELDWHYDPNKSLAINEPLARVQIGERDFLGEVVRLGHGMQRSFIIAVLQELVASGTEEGPTLLLAIEEPELYQHPPQARHFARLLENISSENAQAIVTTHSPYFVSGRGFEAVRMVRQGVMDQGTRVRQMTYEQLATTLADALGAEPSQPTSVLADVEQILQPSQSELFFAEVPIVVEGLEDVALVATHLRLTNQWDEFRKLGCHFVVSMGKTNLSRPLAIANGLGIPAFTVFDADGDVTGASERERNERDNTCLLTLSGAATEDPFPSDPIWGERFVMWPTNILDTVRAEVGPDTWDDAEATARREQGFEAGVRRKNSLLLAAVIEDLWGHSHRSSSLDNLCKEIIEFASAARANSYATGKPK